MIPLYGFLEGDTLGLLMLTNPDETLGALARRLEASASTRVAPPRPGQSLQVRVAGRTLDHDATVGEAGLAALDRFDVTRAAPERERERRQP